MKTTANPNLNNSAHNAGAYLKKNEQTLTLYSEERKKETELIWRNNRFYLNGRPIITTGVIELENKFLVEQNLLQDIRFQRRQKSRNYSREHTYTHRFVLLPL